jgi:hypothetical protein
MPIKRLTPIVPGEMQPVLFVDDRIHTGFVSGGPTEGRGFPQWSKVLGSDTAHYFQNYDAYGVSMSLCGRVEQHWKWIFMPGNYARCKDCEKRYSKMIRKQAVAHG